MRVLTLLSATVILALTGCGPSTPAPSTTQPPSQSASQPPATQSSGTQPGGQPTAKPTTGKQPTPVVPPAPEGDGASVPDVVGMNHQKAQDTMQAAGFFHLAEEDATGKGRLLVVDSNWQVVEQIPAAGTRLAKTEKVLLRSKKIGE